MNKMAEHLRSQARALASIGKSGLLKGEYADELVDSTQELSGKLGQTEVRYREVSSHLGSWADELEDIQSRADRALRDAQEAERSARPDSTPGRNSEQQGADSPAGTEDDRTTERAREELEIARQRLSSAEADYHERSENYAGRILGSVDDGLKDSLWDDFTGLVADAEWLDDVANWASWAATVIGIIAIIFPAVGVIALVLTGVVMAINLLQATTGNGSWFDVAMDLGCLKLARSGIKAARTIRSLQSSSRDAAAGIARSSATTRAAQATSRQHKTATRAGRRRGGSSRRLRERARARKLHIEQKNLAIGKNAAQEVRDAPLPRPTFREKMQAIGDESLARQIKDINKWSSAHPNNEFLSRTAVEAERQRRIVRGTWGISTALDFGDKSGDYISQGEYGEMKGRMTTTVGSQW
ncbi:hypothetical protein [Streptomyces sp. WMMC905]|uniref:hypothetical protein n=1 Tax=Streptomyces sp. WMMC905 TaxID=3404123 RepID=UPI003B92F37D